MHKELFLQADVIHYLFDTFAQYPCSRVSGFTAVKILEISNGFCRASFVVVVVVVSFFLVFTEFFKDVICLNFRHPSKSHTPERDV